MKMIFLMIWTSMLAMANLFMFIIVCCFCKSTENRASRIGNDFMKILALSNFFTIWGGMIWGF